MLAPLQEEDLAGSPLCQRGDEKWREGDHHGRPERGAATSKPRENGCFSTWCQIGPKHPCFLKKILSIGGITSVAKTWGAKLAAGWFTTWPRNWFVVCSQTKSGKKCFNNKISNHVDIKKHQPGCWKWYVLEAKLSSENPTKQSQHPAHWKPWK